MQLSDIAEYVSDTVRSDSIRLEQYVTTDSLLQNKEGRCCATNLPPKVGSLVAFKKGDTLVANIRPYLKKIWLADCCGGASQDVLVFRAKKGVPQEYLFATLLQNAFFDYVMKAPKGSKMPRGDESHIMRFPLSQIDSNDQRKIGKFVSLIECLIRLSRKRIENLEKLAKEIYDYWFVQFDFPDKRGKPYKSSGGKMVYNVKLKREIPAGWKVVPLPVIADYLFGYAFDAKLFNEDGNGLKIVRIRNVKNGTTKDYTTEVAPSSYIVRNGDFLIGMDGYFDMNLWVGGDAYLVQRSCRVKTKDRRYQAYVRRFIAPLIKRLEQRLLGVTVAHLGKRHLDAFQIAVPDENLAALDLLNKYDSLIVKCGEQIVQLTQLREFLLPLLMNGQAKMR